MSTFEQITSMKYSTAKNDEILAEALASSNYVLTLKRDGCSYNLAKDSEGKPHLWGDGISKKTGEGIDKIENFQYIKEWIIKNFPNETMITAELYTFYDYGAGEYRDRETSKYMNSLCLCNPEKCNARIAATTKPNVYMFDLLWFNGVDYRDKPFFERDAKLSEFYLTQKEPWLEKAELVTDNKFATVSEWLRNGFEGGVLKRIDAPYAWAPLGATAKRPAHVSYKIKQIDTVDVVIMGTTLPEKEYKGKDPENYPYRDEEGNPVNRLWALGMINAFVVGAYDKNGCLVQVATVASGLDDEIRLDAAENYGKYDGQTIEVTCMSIDKEGRSLRHPRLRCFRPDKNEKECLIKDIFGGV